MSFAMLQFNAQCLTAVVFLAFLSAFLNITVLGTDSQDVAEHRVRRRVIQYSADGVPSGWSQALQFDSLVNDGHSRQKRQNTNWSSWLNWSSRWSSWSSRRTTTTRRYWSSWNNWKSWSSWNSWKSWNTWTSSRSHPTNIGAIIGGVFGAIIIVVIVIVVCCVVAARSRAQRRMVARSGAPQQHFMAAQYMANSANATTAAGTGYNPYPYGNNAASAPGSYPLGQAVPPAAAPPSAPPGTYPVQQQPWAAPIAPSAPAANEPAPPPPSYDQAVDNPQYMPTAQSQAEHSNLLRQPSELPTYTDYVKKTTPAGSTEHIDISGNTPSAPPQ